MADFKVTGVLSTEIVRVKRSGEKTTHQELWVQAKVRKPCPCARCRFPQPSKALVFAPISNALHRAERLCQLCVAELTSSARLACFYLMERAEDDDGR